jgi:hypothetical protein
MKATLAILTGVFFIGCASDAPEVELPFDEFPQGYEVVVVETDFPDTALPDNNASAESISGNNFPGGADSEYPDGSGHVDTEWASGTTFEFPGGADTAYPDHNASANAQAGNTLPSGADSAYPESSGHADTEWASGSTFEFPGGADTEYPDESASASSQAGNLFPGGADTAYPDSGSASISIGRPGVPDGADSEVLPKPQQRELPERDIPDTRREVVEEESAKDPCRCDGLSCLEEWVADNLGCNVCAVFVCDGGNLGACNPC